MKPQTRILHLWQNFLLLILLLSAVSGLAQTPEPAEEISAAEEAISDAADTDLSASSAQRSKRKPVRIISPAEDEQMQTAPVELKIRFRQQPQAATVRAYLNEKDVTSKFAPVSKDACNTQPCDFAATVFGQDGLQLGENKLRVVAGEPNSSMAEATRSFSVTGPKADAGPDQRLKIGQMVELDGSKSVSALPLSHRWVLSQKPNDSKATILNPSSAKPVFVADVKGSYVAQLVVHDGHFESVADTVVADVNLAFMMVPMQTRAVVTGALGFSIVVNDLPYPAYPVTSGFNILTLSRDTLAFVSQKAIDTSSGSPAAVQGYLNAVLNTQSPDVLVIIATANRVGIDLAQIAPQLEKLGATTEFRNIHDPEFILSLIGNNKGLKPGNAYQAGPANPNLLGYLTPDSNFNYTFMPQDFVQFQIKEANQTGLTNLITVGERQYAAPPLPSGAAGGYQVLALDRGTLQLISNVSYGTNQSNPVPEMQRMASDLNALANARGPSTLLMVSNIGGPNTASLQFPEIAVKQAGLQTALAAWGANPYVVMLLRSTDSYSLVGGVGLQRDDVIETSTVARPKVAQGATSGAIRGMLTRDQRNLFSPAVSDLDLLAKVSYDLYDSILTPSSNWQQWPQMDAPGKRNAYRYLSRASLNCVPADTSSVCDDIRLNKYDVWDETPSAWAGNIRNLPYPGAGAGFSQQEFTDVQAQLLNEYDYLSRIFNHRTSLKGLLTDNKTNVSLVLGSAIDVVKSSITIASPEESLGVKIFEWGAKIGESTLGEVPGVGPLLTVTSVVVSIMDELTKTEPGDPFGELNPKLSELKDDAVTAFNQSVGSLDRIVTIWVSDWERLQRVGNHLKFNDVGWVWDTGVEGKVLDSAARAMKRYYYKQLLPTAYALTIIGNSPYTDPPKQAICSNPSWFYNYHSWTNATPAAAAVYTAFRYDPVTWWYPDFFYLVQITGGDGHHYAFPPDTLLAPLFAEEDAGITNLGIPRIEFFTRWPFRQEGPCEGLK